MSGGRVDYWITRAQAENHFLKSEYAQARSIYSHMAKKHPPNCDCYPYAVAIRDVSRIDIKIGRNAKDVQQNLKKAKNIFRNSSDPVDIVLCSMLEAEVELREGKFDLARTKLQECLHSALREQNRIESCCLEHLANIRTWPASEWQSRWPVIYCAFANKSKARLELAKALLFLGDMFMANDKETAANLYLVALEGFTYMDVHHSRAQCMIHLGDLAEGQGHTSKAIGFWEAARPLFEQALQAKDVAQIDARLELVNSHVLVHLVNE
jgi:tetratricopeptide (TPR) repeat protein